MKKKFAALLAGLMVLTAVPVFAATNDTGDNTSYGQGYCRQHDDCPYGTDENQGRHHRGGCFRNGQ